MKIIKCLKSFRIKKKTCLSIGIFDGVHIGHQNILKELLKISKKENLKSVVITFKNLPERKILNQKKIYLIKGLNQRINLLKQFGFDYLIIFDLNKISKIKPEDFINKILVKKLNMKLIVTGRDFKFGLNAKGDVGLLNKYSLKYGYRVRVVKDIKLFGKRISSTLIRKYLEKGKIEKVRKMLGREYKIEGVVVHGKHIGFKYPTANLRIENENIPATGVWAVMVEYAGKRYFGAANIGFAPTLKKEKKKQIEIHIFNFYKNIYGKILKVTFLKKIRNERKFKSIKSLTRQVKNDINAIKKFLKRRGFDEPERSGR